jgi:hypothetical protein
MASSAATARQLIEAGQGVAISRDKLAAPPLLEVEEGSKPIVLELKDPCGSVIHRDISHAANLSMKSKSQDKSPHTEQSFSSLIQEIQSTRGSEAVNARSGLMAERGCYLRWTVAFSLLPGLFECAPHAELPGPLSPLSLEYRQDRYSHCTAHASDRCV